MAEKEMLEKEKRGEGRIYWFHEDRTVGSANQPIWVPKHLVPRIFGQ